MAHESEDGILLFYYQTQNAYLTLWFSSITTAGNFLRQHSISPKSIHIPGWPAVIITNLVINDLSKNTPLKPVGWWFPNQSADPLGLISLSKLLELMRTLDEHFVILPLVSTTDKSVNTAMEQATKHSMYRLLIHYVAQGDQP